MNAVELRRKHKSFGLSIPFFHPASLVVSVGGMGYLPRYKLAHLGAMAAGLVTPILIWWLGGAHSYVPALALLVISCVAGWFALAVLHKIGIESDHDASAIVLDEVAGSSLGMLALPLMVQWLGYDACMAFVGAFFIGWLFRVFDLYKPYPANVMDTTWHHPFSVMADDLVAGVYTAVGALVFAYVLAFVF